MSYYNNIIYKWGNVHGTSAATIRTYNYCLLDIPIIKHFILKYDYGNDKTDMHCCRVAVARRFTPCVVRYHQPTNLPTYLPGTYLYTSNLPFSITDLFFFIQSLLLQLFFAIRAIARAHTHINTHIQTCPPADSLIRPKFNLFVSISSPSIRPRYNTSNLSESIALHTCVSYIRLQPVVPPPRVYLEPTTTGHRQVIYNNIMCI